MFLKKMDFLLFLGKKKQHNTHLDAVKICFEVRLVVTHDEPKGV